jgi:hypothetical protein
LVKDCARHAICWVTFNGCPVIEPVNPEGWKSTVYVPGVTQVTLTRQSQLWDIASESHAASTSAIELVPSPLVVAAHSTVGSEAREADAD